MNPSARTEAAPRRVVRTMGSRLVRVLTSIALVLAVSVGIAVADLAGARGAAAVPAATTEPATADVTADALPTVQIDGVVWAQAVVGNNVYAGGSFANARPAGAAPGTNLTPRANLLSYNITTGALNTSFAPSLNGAVKAVASSPDGSRVYVGGAFTQADGRPRYRLAAYSTATGQLISTFQPVLDYTVNAIVATNTTVYVGGGFSSANNVARSHLAAFSAADGSLLDWAPTADDHEVEAMVMAPGGGKIVVGGSFTTLNGSSAGYGLGALDATTGALLSWPATSVVRDAGDNGAILSLTTDGTAVYATGYSFGTGANFEGAASMNPSTGAINWLQDCHGDTYSAFPVNGAVYTVSHAHYCGNVGGFPQPAVWQYHHALAFTTQATGTLLTDSVGYPNFGGQPSPSLLNWFPDLDAGTFTGQDQAAWNVTGNSKYVVLGGEFPTVNGVPQQGLVRFGVPSVSTNRQAPMDSGANFMPTLRAVSASSVRVSWPANWDRDDQKLTYRVVRNGDVNHPIFTTTGTSQFWNRPTMGFVDTGLSAATSYDYRLNVTDSDGHVVWGDTASITTPTTSPSGYAQQIPADNAASYWRLDQTAGSTLSDAAGADDLTRATGVTGGAAGAIDGDLDTAATFNGTSTGTAYTSTAVPAPNTYSLEAWFKTTTHSGGKIIGFGNSQESSSVVDRQIYMTNSGHLVYGVWQNQNTAVTSASTYNDGKWHQVVATLSSAGMVLFVDGRQVAADSTVTTGRPYYGYWRVGGDSLSGWPSAPSSGYLDGSIDDVAVYPAALPLATVQSHYALSGRTVPGGADQAPTAAFTSACTALACSFNGSGSTDSDGSIASYAWTFGDGTSDTGATPAHSYAAAGTYAVTLTVTDNQGASNAVTHTVTVSAPTALTASFTHSCTRLACTFDGSSSIPASGSSIRRYEWSYGDRRTGNGVRPSHTYSAARTYTVRLTVSDRQGRTASTSRQITVTAAAKAVRTVISDHFTQAVRDGWGTAAKGGAWTATPESVFAVTGGRATVRMTKSATKPTASLPGVSRTDMDVTFDSGLSTAPTGRRGALVSVVLRNHSGDNYRFTVRYLPTGATHLLVSKAVNGTETVLREVTVSGLHYQAGTMLRAQVRITGTNPTRVAGRVWKVGAAAPETAQIKVTDQQDALQRAGSFAVRAFLAGAAAAPVVGYIDNLSATTG